MKTEKETPFTKVWKNYTKQLTQEEKQMIANMSQVLLTEMNKLINAGANINRITREVESAFTTSYILGKHLERK